MNILKKIISLLIAFVMAFAINLAAAEEYTGEVVEMFGVENDETTDEEKEYIVYFNDSVVSLYADEGKEYSILTEEELNKCLDEGIVKYYEEDAYVYLYGDFSDYDPMQEKYKWDINMINADYALERGYTGKGVKIAVIDSGCSITGDLSENILEGYNLVTKTTDVKDEVNHGTFVSSQIAAEMNDVGFRGVAPEAKIVPLKIFEGRLAKVSLLAEAIKMAVDDYKCDIINMSLGTSSDSETLKAAVEYAAGNNVLMIAGMGNKGDETYSYPAAYDEVIAVGAVDHKKKVCDYSQHNETIDVCAPGGSLERQLACLSPTSDKNYFQSKGTSFAVPVVTGIAAIFYGMDEDFAPEDFMEMVEKSSVDLGDDGFDEYYGYGMVDVKKYIDYYFAPMGDNDADGVITMDDAMNIAKYVVGSIGGIVKAENADVDKDGKITLRDAIMVARAAERWDGYEFATN